MLLQTAHFRLSRVTLASPRSVPRRPAGRGHQRRVVLVIKIWRTCFVLSLKKTIPEWDLCAHVSTSWCTVCFLGILVGVACHANLTANTSYSYSLGSTSMSTVTPAAPSTHSLHPCMYTSTRRHLYFCSNRRRPTLFITSVIPVGIEVNSGSTTARTDYKTGLWIGTLNANSAVHKAVEIQVVIRVNLLDVLLVSETGSG